MIAEAGSTLENLRKESARQSKLGQQLRTLLAVLSTSIDGHITWISQDGGVWGAVFAACGYSRLSALAADLGLDASRVSPKDVFLLGLSTVSTYRRSWDLALRFSSGAIHETFMNMQRIENAVNTIARRIFEGAAYYYRGESVSETVGVRHGTVGPARNYSYVPLSSDPVVAARFASTNQRWPDEAKVVLAIDARMAQKLGIFPATYSMASDALNLLPSEESTGRTFPVGLAHELQAHFCAGWPPGSAGAMAAIITTVPLPPEHLRRLEETGIPVLDGGAVMP